MKKPVFISLVVVFILLAGSPLFAQEEEEKPTFITISTFKVRFDQIGTYLDLFEKHWLPIIKENDLIKSNRVFTHYWGPDWTVLVIVEYDSFAAIDASQVKLSDLMKEKYPDEAKRQEISKKIGSLVLGHTDAIVTEVKKLRK